MDAVAYIAALRQAIDLASPAGRPPHRRHRRRHDRDRHRQPDQAAGRRGRHHRLPPRPGADGRLASTSRSSPRPTASCCATGCARRGCWPRAAGSAGVELDYTDGRTETLTLPCDQLFKAIGQAFLPADVDGSRELVELEHGRIAVDAERRTSLSGVWAGGDCVAGGKDLTVTAVEDGKQAALSIDRALRAATAARAA